MMKEERCVSSGHVNSSEPWGSVEYWSVRPVSRKPPLRSHELIRYKEPFESVTWTDMRTSELVGVMGVTSGYRVHL